MLLHTKFRYILCISLSVFAFNVGAQQNKIDLIGNWKFTIGDNPEYALNNFNDEKWQLLKKMGYIEDNGFPDYVGFAWMRRKINIPSSFKNAAEKAGCLYLILGEIDDADETFFNEKSIGKSGEFPPQYVTAYNKFRMYKIDTKSIKWDSENTIAIRVYDFMGNGGFFHGPYFLHIPSISDFEKGKFKGDSSKIPSDFISICRNMYLNETLKSNAQILGGLRVNNSINSPVFLYVNNNFIGKSDFSANHSQFVPLSNINWGATNQVCYFVNQRNFSEQMMFADVSFESASLIDIFSVEPNIKSKTNLTVGEKISGEIILSNNSNKELKGKLILTVVNDFQNKDSESIENIQLRTNSKKNISINILPKIKGPIKLIYNFVSENEGVKISGVLYKGLIE
jgi:hypothetical protein